jgi:hypothetical protein
MSRNKFPYTARSTARFIRHAVSIGERRAKFRQDLISEKPKHKRAHYRATNNSKDPKEVLTKDHQSRSGRARVTDLPSQSKGALGMLAPETNEQLSVLTNGETDRGRPMTLNVPERFRDPSETSGIRSRSRARSAFSSTDTASNESLNAIRQVDVTNEDEEQDIQEVWFAGCHAVRFFAYCHCQTNLNPGYWWRLAIGRRRRGSTIAHSPSVDG